MKRITILLLSAISIFMISCTQNIFHNTSTGELSLTLPYGNSSSARFINADTTESSSIIYKFKVSLTSADGIVLEKDGKSGDTIAFTDLATGDYEVSVDAYFSTDFLVFTGKEKASVKTGQQTPVTVNMEKYDGSKKTHISVTPDETSGINVAVTIPDNLDKFNYCYIEELKTGLRVDLSRNSSMVSGTALNFNYPFTDKDVYYGFTLHYELQNQKEVTEFVYCTANGGDTTSLKRSGIIPSSASDATIEKTEDPNTTSLNIKIKSDILDIVPDDSDSFISTRKLDIILLRGKETYYSDSKKDKLLTNIKYLSYGEPDYESLMSTGVTFGPEGVDEYKEILSVNNTIDRLIAGYNQFTAVVQGYFFTEQDIIFSLPPIVKTFESSLGKKYNGYLNVFKDYTAIGNTPVVCKAIYHSPKKDDYPTGIVTVEKYEQKKLLYNSEEMTLTDYDEEIYNADIHYISDAQIAKIKINNVPDGVNVLSLDVGIVLKITAENPTPDLYNTARPIDVDFSAEPNYIVPYDLSSDSGSLLRATNASTGTVTTISAQFNFDSNFTASEEKPYPDADSGITSSTSNVNRSDLKFTITPRRKGTYLMIFGKKIN